MGPRWKGRSAERNALSDPMSDIVSMLQSSMIHMDSRGILSGCSVLLASDVVQACFLKKSCFGRPIIAKEDIKQWFQFTLEEAFYLCYVMKCLKIVGENSRLISYQEFWLYAKSKKVNFPTLFKAYSDLRLKNWVVKVGSQYGVDFVAYRHHPSLVHSEYAVLVSSGEKCSENDRLRVWSDFQCTLRLCGSVAKTLLVIHVDKNGNGANSPLCLEGYTVEERTVTRWNPEQSREDRGVIQKESVPTAHHHEINPSNSSRPTPSQSSPPNTLSSTDSSAGAPHLQQDIEPPTHPTAPPITLPVRDSGRCGFLYGYNPETGEPNSPRPMKHLSVPWYMVPPRDEPMGTVTYENGIPTITFSKEESEFLAIPFKNALVGKSVGTANLKALGKYLDNMGMKGPYTLDVMRQGYALINFKEEEDSNRLFAHSELIVGGKTMKLVRWTTDISWGRE